MTPTYIFEITHDLSEIMASTLPDSLENINFNLKNRTIWIETIDRPLKSGDQFTVSGVQAQYLIETYINIPNPLLKIITAVEEESNPPSVTTDDLIMGPSSSDYGFVAPMAALAVGTITNSGSSPITEYGFVWADHDAPTLDDNVEIVDEEDFNGEFHTTISELDYPLTVYFAAYATNAVGTSYGAILSGETEICLAAGTKITLANGEKKNIEDVTYNDDLLVWDFDQQRLSSSKPVWMVRPFTSHYFGMVEFSNGTKLKTVADGKGHRIFNKNKGMFTYSMNEDTPINTSTITSNQETVHVINKEIVKEDTTFYNIVTHTHFNMFANDVLTSTGLNNLYPILDMKFVKEYPRQDFTAKDFDKIPLEIVKGLRLLEQPSDYPHLNIKLDRMLSRMAEK